MFTKNPVTFTSTIPSIFPAAMATAFQQYASVDGVHILAQSNVTAAQLTYVAGIMRGLAERDTDGAVNRTMVAAGATLVMFNDASAMEAASPALRASIESTSFMVQDLQADEVILPTAGIGVRDATIEEVTHLMHNSGITTALPEFQAALQAANDASIARGQYFPLRVSADLPPVDYDDEYLAIGVEAFYNVRASTDNGAHPSLIREQLSTQDPALFSLVNSFFPNTLPIAQTGRNSNFDNTQGGDAAANIFASSLGNDVFRGFGGVDTVQYNVARALVTTAVATDGQITATGHGTDILTGIERLTFTDGTVAFDIAGSAGSIYRLYRAAFARTPDQGGLKSWIGHADTGTSLIDISAFFIESPEFTTRYGASITNASFVDQLYQNALNRAGDAGGVAFWNSELDSNARSRHQVVLEFSDSTENVAAVAPTIADGIIF